MKNVIIELNGRSFSLIDSSRNELINSEDWDEILEYAESEDVNIQYQPKDLFFSLPDDGSEFMVFFDSKYEEGKDNLGGHNVINLPPCIDPVEEAECTFAVVSGASKEDVKSALEQLGAKYKEWNDDDDD